jgi:hypothetical protein
MLDASFGYAPDAIDGLKLDPGQRDVVRERVSRAWKSRVDARACGETPSMPFRELVERAVATLRAPPPAVEPRVSSPTSSSTSSASGDEA